jgi:hypothetical protein
MQTFPLNDAMTARQICALPAAIANGDLSNKGDAEHIRADQQRKAANGNA